MRKALTKRLVVLATALLFLALTAMPGWNHTPVVFAQDGAPADITETPTEPPPPTPTDTATPTPTDTATPTPTNTTVAGETPTDTPISTPTNTVTPTPTTIPLSPPSGPVPVPEPVTVVLFGTGLAALSAAVAARRKNNKE